MRRRAALHTLLALTPPVILSIGLAEAGLAAARELLPRVVLEQSSGAVGDYLQTLGTVYAVLLAFVVFVVWSQFNDARGQVEREATELLDLYRCARGLPARSREQVQGRVADYVDGVLGREWEAMACGDEGAFDTQSQLLDRLWDDLHTAEPETGCGQAIHADMLTRFNDLSDARTNRLTSAMLKIPLAMKLLLYAGAVIMVGSMYLFGVERAWVHALLTGALAGALSHVLYLVHDLDNCFAGDWQVPRSAFERVQRYIRKHAADGAVCE